jgi:cytidine deaminase
MKIQTFSSIATAAPQIKELFELAKTARQRAYCRYSGYQVGAAIRLHDGRTFSGCNVENASYGATVCAERVAIQNAVCEVGGTFTLAQVMVVTDSDPAWPPCGMCRQVIAEFSQNTLIYTANLEGQYETFPFAELFPQAFSPQQMHSETARS